MKIIKAKTSYTDHYQPGPIIGAAKTVAGIRGSYIYFHAVQSCAHTGDMMLRAGPVIEGERVPSGVPSLERTDIILGGNENRLVNTIRDGVAKVRPWPKLIFIFTSDATSLIREDLQLVASNLEQELDIPVIPIDTAGYLGGFNWGSERVWCAILDRFVKETPEVRGGLNLVGPHLMGSKNWPDDIKEIERLLAAAEVPVNATMFRNIGGDELGKLAKANCNYILTCEDFPQFETQCRQLDMPRWGQDLVLPLGLYNTEEWYLTIAREFGNVEQAKAQLERDMNLVKSQMMNNYNVRSPLQAMTGKHVGIMGFAPFAAALARCVFYDFDMRPNVIALLAETGGALERAEKLLEPMESLCDFEVMENPTYWDYVHKLEEAQVEMALGMEQEHDRVVGASIPHRSLGGWYLENQFNFVPWPYMGVRGMLYLTAELWEVTRAVLDTDDLWQQRRYQARDEISEPVQVMPGYNEVT